MSRERPWPEIEAERIAASVGEKSEVVLQTGFGPSGPPHIGTYGEIIRTAFVKLALSDLGFQSRIISFLDDLDGLRKVPEGFPGWLSEYLGMSVCDIPDPFDCCPSYARHMHKLLFEMVDQAGVECDYLFSSEQYRSGRFDEAIETVMSKVDELRSMVVPMLSSQVGARWFPFFARCEKCQRLYTTRVVSFDAGDKTVEYVCDGEFGGARGCGHRGRTGVLGGKGKLPWRIDWPARWAVFGVDYEIHGKDLIESAKLGKRIMSRVFGKRPPRTMVYELFLDADGTKISKSKGFAIDPGVWLRYGTLDSLHLVLYKKPRQAKRLDLFKMPSYVDEAHRAARDYYSAGDNMKGPGHRHAYEFITLFRPPAAPPLEVEFSTLCNLVAALGEGQTSIIRRYASRLIGDSGAIDRSLLDDLIAKARRFAEEVWGRREPVALELSDKEEEAVDRFLSYLDAGNHTSQEVQTKVFDISKELSIPQARMFQILYLLILGQPQGPRLGEFISILGEEKAASRIRASLQRGKEERQ